MPEFNRQYVSVLFNPWDRRTYTYHNDGPPVEAGDRVVVSTDRGPSTVEVVSVGDTEPPFATKPIVGKERVDTDTLADADDRDFIASREDR